MRKLMGICGVLMLVGLLHAEISVKSFRKLDNDMTARIDAPMKDQNGEDCAIIKVVTTQTGFSFDGGQLGIVKTVQKPSEIWVYVPHGLKRLSVFHSQLGQLRDYMIPESVEKSTVYEMVLVTGRIETTVVEEIASQWLVMKSDVPNSIFYINDEWKNNGSECQQKLKSGKYSYRVEAPMYHSEAGVVEITDSKQEINVHLKPAFGYLQINTTPESGATILIDEKPINGATPVKTDALPSGEHTVQVIKDMYAPTREKVVVKDGETVAVNMVMNPSYAELGIVSISNATLKINGVLKGNTQWQGRLAPGVYSLEAQLDKHRTAKQDIELVVGDQKKVELKPVPIVGSLDIITSPSGASVTIGGKDYGTTPATINKLLIGDYNVQLSKTGYATVSKTVTVSEGKNSELNETLSNGKQVNISSNPSGADLYIDNQRVGKTPYSGSLTYGNHLLRVEQDGKQNEKNIEVTAASSPDVEIITRIKIGDKYAGGIVFYVDATGKHGLVCAPTDQSSSIQFYNGSYTEIGGTGEGIGSGKANTQAIIKRQGAGEYAAKLCADLSLNGYHDWFLPSKDEMELMYKNLHQHGLGNFASRLYWTSSDHSNNGAYLCNFSYGTPNSNYKYNAGSVRAARAFDVNANSKPNKSREVDKVIDSKSTLTTEEVKKTNHKIGDMYAGGIVFYLDATGKHGLVCAPTDQSTGIRWCNLTYTWTGETDKGIGTGKANTKAIIKRQGEGSYAAKLCADLSLNGYHDWFLPSIDELELMHQNLHIQGLGDFGGAPYWSSSESRYSAPWNFSFIHGETSCYFNSNLFKYVRAVRAF